MTLSSSLNIGAQSLYANRQGVDTTGHNIANAQTEGYSRQKVNLTQRDPLERGGLIVGNGAYVGSIARAHDGFIEKQFNLATQDVGDAKARADAMKAIESIFSPEMQAAIPDQMARFFNSLQDLSQSPEEAHVRALVVESARDLCNAFQKVEENLKRNQYDLNLKIEGEVKEASTMLARMALLNEAIGTMEVGGQSQANDLRDERDLLLNKLSEKMDITYYTSDAGMLTVRGPKQTLLLDGRYHSSLDVGKDSKTGHYNILVVDPTKTNVTRVDDALRKGKLAAIVDVRDRVVGGVMRQNNDLAAGFAYHVNSIHSEGFGLGDFSESTGRNLFEVADSIDQAAGTIRITDQIQGDLNALSAAITPNAPGDNVIINRLATLRDEKVMGGGRSSFVEHYSTIVGNLGLEVQRSFHKLEADSLVHGDLSSRREAVSGVSLDEEAVNLIRWQTAFTASSELITTVDEMYDTVLSLKR